MARKRKNRVSEKQDQPATTADAAEVVVDQVEPPPAAEAVADTVTDVEAEVSIVEVANLAPAPEAVAVSAPVVEPKTIVSVKETVVSPSVMHIEQAANELIKNFRPGWMAAIKVRAGMMNVDVKVKQSLETWRAVFIAWGGKSVIK